MIPNLSKPAAPTKPIRGLPTPAMVWFLVLQQGGITHFRQDFRFSDLPEKSRSQGNVCQGNGRRRFTDDSPDNHSPDFSPALSVSIRVHPWFNAFTIQNSKFTILNSAFSIHHSQFTILNSAACTSCPADAPLGL
ncbi:MAG: hypothetical protein ABSG04_14165 [Verrucomicrobiota bacterium]